MNIFSTDETFQILLVYGWLNPLIQNPWIPSTRLYCLRINLSFHVFLLTRSLLKSSLQPPSLLIPTPHPQNCLFQTSRDLEAKANGHVLFLTPVSHSIRHSWPLHPLESVFSFDCFFTTLTFCSVFLLSLSCDFLLCVTFSLVSQFVTGSTQFINTILGI